MKDKKIPILVFLIVIMLFVWMRSCAIVLKKGRLKSSTPVKLSLQQAEPQSKAVLEPRTRPRSQFKEWGRSPFVLQKSKKYGSGLILGGILWDKDNPQAIINNQVVGLNDELEGYKIIEIRKDRVILSDGANKIELKL